jgi:hypothetical protein
MNFSSRTALHGVSLKTTRRGIMSGRTMAQAVSRRHLIAEARVCTRISPCGICDGQSVTETGFSQSSSVFPCQYNPTAAPYSFIYYLWDESCLEGPRFLY